MENPITKARFEDYLRRVDELVDAANKSNARGDKHRAAFLLSRADGLQKSWGTLLHGSRSNCQPSVTRATIASTLQRVTQNVAARTDPWRGSGAPSGPWDPADSVAWLPTGKSPVPHNRKNTRPTTASIRLHQQQYSNIAMEEQHSPFSSTLQSAMARETVMALNFSRLTADDDLFLSPLQGASISENVTTTNIVPPNSRSQAEMHSVQQKLQQQQQQQHGNPRATASSSMVASTQLPSSASSFSSLSSNSTSSSALAEFTSKGKRVEDQAWWWHPRHQQPPRGLRILEQIRVACFGPVDQPPSLVSPSLSPTSVRQQQQQQQQQLCRHWSSFLRRHFGYGHAHEGGDGVCERCRGGGCSSCNSKGVDPTAFLSLIRRVLRLTVSQVSDDNIAAVYHTILSSRCRNEQMMHSTPRRTAKNDGSVITVHDLIQFACRKGPVWQGCVETNAANNTTYLAAKVAATSKKLATAAPCDGVAKCHHERNSGNGRVDQASGVVNANVFQGVLKERTRSALPNQEIADKEEKSPADGTAAATATTIIASLCSGGINDDGIESLHSVSSYTMAFSHAKSSTSSSSPPSLDRTEENDPPPKSLPVTNNQTAPVMHSHQKELNATPSSFSSLIRIPAGSKSLLLAESLLSSPEPPLPPPRQHPHLETNASIHRTTPPRRQQATRAKASPAASHFPSTPLPRQTATSLARARLHQHHSMPPPPPPPPLPPSSSKRQRPLPSPSLSHRSDPREFSSPFPSSSTALPVFQEPAYTRANGYGDSFTDNPKHVRKRKGSHSAAVEESSKDIGQLKRSSTAALLSGRSQATAIHRRLHEAVAATVLQAVMRRFLAIITVFSTGKIDDFLWRTRQRVYALKRSLTEERLIGEGATLQGQVLTSYTTKSGSLTFSSPSKVINAGISHRFGCFEKEKKWDSVSAISILGVASDGDGDGSGNDSGGKQSDRTEPESAATSDIGASLSSLSVPNEETLRERAAEQAVSAAEKVEVLSETLKDRDVHIDMLVRQLSDAGLVPITEVVSLEQAEASLKVAFERLMNGEESSVDNGGSAGGEATLIMFTAQAAFDKWDTFIRNHPDHIEKTKKAALEWCDEQAEPNNAARLEMRSFVPADIWQSDLTRLKSSYAALAAASPPSSSAPGANTKALSSSQFEEIAKRVWQRKVLWFVRADPSLISTKIHAVDLHNKYSTQGLDLAELRAVWASLPRDGFKNDADGRKDEWRVKVLDQLRELVKKEQRGELRPTLRRALPYTRYQQFKLQEQTLITQLLQQQQRKQSQADQRGRSLSGDNYDDDDKDGSFSGIPSETMTVETEILAIPEKDQSTTVFHAKPLDGDKGDTKNDSDKAAFGSTPLSPAPPSRDPPPLPSLAPGVSFSLSSSRAGFGPFNPSSPIKDQIKVLVPFPEIHEQVVKKEEAGQETCGVGDVQQEKMIDSSSFIEDDAYNPSSALKDQTKASVFLPGNHDQGAKKEEAGQEKCDVGDVQKEKTTDSSLVIDDVEFNPSLSLKDQTKASVLCPGNYEQGAKEKEAGQEKCGVDNVQKEKTTDSSLVIDDVEFNPSLLLKDQTKAIELCPGNHEQGAKEKEVGQEKCGVDNVQKEKTTDSSLVIDDVEFNPSLSLKDQTKALVLCPENHYQGAKKKEVGQEKYVVDDVQQEKTIDSSLVIEDVGSSSIYSNHSLMQQGSQVYDESVCEVRTGKDFKSDEKCEGWVNLSKYNDGLLTSSPSQSTSSSINLSISSPALSLLRRRYSGCSESALEVVAVPEPLACDSFAPDDKASHPLTSPVTPQRSAGRVADGNKWAKMLKRRSEKKMCSPSSGSKGNLASSSSSSPATNQNPKKNERPIPNMMAELTQKLTRRNSNTVANADA